MAVAVALASSAARAQQEQALSPAKRARVHFDRGQTYFDLNQYDRAIAEFEAVYRLTPIPLILFDIANVARVAGMTDKAIEYFHKYLAVAPSSAHERAESRRWLDELRRQPARPSASRKVEAHRLGGETDSAVGDAPHPSEPPRPSEPPHALEPTTPPPATTPPATTPPATTPPVRAAPTENAPAAPALIAPAVVIRALPPRQPVYKRWWLWTTVALVVGAGVGVGLGLGLTQPYSYPMTPTQLGTFRF